MINLLLRVIMKSQLCWKEVKKMQISTLFQTKGSICSGTRLYKPKYQLQKSQNAKTIRARLRYREMKENCQVIWLNNTLKWLMKRTRYHLIRIWKMREEQYMVYLIQRLILASIKRRSQMDPWIQDYRTSIKGEK